MKLRQARKIRRRWCDYLAIIMFKTDGYLSVRCPEYKMSTMEKAIGMTNRWLNRRLSLAPRHPKFWFWKD